MCQIPIVSSHTANSSRDKNINPIIDPYINNHVLWRHLTATVFHQNGSAGTDAIWAVLYLICSADLHLIQLAGVLDRLEYGPGVPLAQLHARQVPAVPALDQNHRPETCRRHRDHRIRAGKSTVRPIAGSEPLTWDLPDTQGSQDQSWKSRKIGVIAYLEIPTMALENDVHIENGENDLDEIKNWLGGFGICEVVL